MEKRVISTQLQEEDYKIESSLRPQLGIIFGRKNNIKYKCTLSTMQYPGSSLRTCTVYAGTICKMYMTGRNRLAEKLRRTKR